MRGARPRPPRRRRASPGRIGLVPQQEALFERQTRARVRAPGRPAPRRRRPGRARPGAALGIVELDPDDRRRVADLLQGHAPAGEGGAGPRPRPARARARRAAHRPRPAPAPPHDRPVPPPRATTGRCVVVSSHVLDEVERFGSRVLVIAQGRLAAEGDFRAIRDLMDDRPHRFASAPTTPAGVAAGLLCDGAGRRGLRLSGAGPGASSTPTTSPRFRRAVAAVARDRRRPPVRGAPARRRPRERLPLPGGLTGMSTDVGTDGGRRPARPGSRPRPGRRSTACSSAG